MKKLRLKQWVKDLLVIILFYSIIIGGLVINHYRIEQNYNIDKVVR